MLRERKTEREGNVDVSDSPWRSRHGGCRGSGSSGVGRGVDVERGAETAVKAVVLPVACSTPLNRSRVGIEVGHLAAQGNLVLCVPAPTSLLWCCAMGGHQPWSGWAPPIRTWIQVPNWPLVEIKLTFSPLISPYSLNLTYLLYLIPIPSQISA